MARPWTVQELPPTWPDQVKVWSPSSMARALKGFAGRAEPVETDLELPDYLLEEFHWMPNGYYSHNQADGYNKGFELSMMGLIQGARSNAASRLAAEGARTALDVGSGTGRQANALLEAGIDEVWGLEPSPYLLNIAAAEFPRVRFVHGVIEDAELPSEYFDAVAACFLFHELPSDVADKALARLYACMSPGALLAITEPGPAQVREDLLSLTLRHGLRGLWFGCLGRFVYEPYLEQWHGTRPGPWLARHGFQLIEDREQLPFRMLLARRC
jgi:ubiquinone/menaquinone biosynthesis C-methylase UbiE